MTKRKRWPFCKTCKDVKTLSVQVVKPTDTKAKRQAEFYRAIPCPDCCAPVALKVSRA